MSKGERGKAEGGEGVAGEDAQAETAGDGGSAHEGSDKLGKEQKAAALVGQAPVVEELRKKGAENYGAEAGKQEAGGEDGRRWPGIRPGVGGAGRPGE